jgi:tetratricopeptide (TPR) repeat protein
MLPWTACARAEREVEATPQEILEDARSSTANHDYGTAENLYRRLLELETPPRSQAYLRLQLGRCLQAYRSFDHARLEFQWVLDLPVDEEQDDDVKPAAQAAIAEGFEAQSRWTEALEAYRISRDKYPSQHWCGNCKHDRRQRILDSIERCIRRVEEK